MRMYDIIDKKKNKLELTKEEINFFIEGYCNDEIPDSQVSSLLMAICLNGMTFDETYNLTIAMRDSGAVLDLSILKEDGSLVIDKHSTGGVGDKVTLIVLPIVAALGGKCFKMAGKGLGYTGGTADKLESIKGYDIYKDLDLSIEQLKDINVCLISQSKELAIADKKLYALRDVTATVDSIYLIAASVMSKKLALGIDKIVIDVTVGSGAFMKNIQDAKKLSKIMIEIGKKAGLETKCIITDMDEPLGKSVGNVLEVKEVISFLLSDVSTLESYENKGIKTVVFELAAQMLKMLGLGDDIEQNKVNIMECITSRQAYDKFIELIYSQGGHLQNVYMDYINLSIDMPVLKDNVKYMKEIKADKSGYITRIDGKKIGEALVALGGGRNLKEDIIDYAVGFEFNKKVGDKVDIGDVIINTLYNDKNKFANAYEYLKDAIVIDNIEQNMANVLKSRPSILDIID